MDDLSINFELDHLETMVRKDGILYLRKAYHRKRDMILSLLTSLDRNVVLITIGRDINKVENLQHYNLKSLIRVKDNEANGLLSWSDDMETFRYVASTIDKSVELAKELAQRGDVVIFSPYGNEFKISNWYASFEKSIQKLIA